MVRTQYIVKTVICSSASFLRKMPGANSHGSGLDFADIVTPFWAEQYSFSALAAIGEELELHVQLHYFACTTETVDATLPSKIQHRALACKTALRGTQHCTIACKTAPPTVRPQPITVRTRGLSVRARAITVRARALTVRTRAITVRARAITVRAQAITVRVRTISVRARALSVRAGAITVRGRGITVRATATTVRARAISVRAGAILKLVPWSPQLQLMAAKLRRLSPQLHPTDAKLFTNCAGWLYRCTNLPHNCTR